MSQTAHALARSSSWLLALVFALVAAVSPPSIIKRMDLVLYDLLEPVFRKPAKPSVSVIVGIDEKTLAALGRWPWDRSIHARLIERLTEVEVAAIGVSILFSEPSDGDEQLVNAIARSGRVVLAVAPRAPEQGLSGVLEIRPTPALADAAAALGHVDVELDADALARRTYLYAGTGGPRWDALALASLKVASGAQQPTPIHPAASAWHRAGELLLPHPDTLSTPDVLSYFDVLQDTRLASLLAGQTVFVGATARGLDAGLATPASPEGQPMAAVEFHARAYEALRSGNFYHSASMALTLGLTLAFLLASAVVFRRAGFRAATGLGALVLVPLLVGGLGLRLGQVWIPPANALIAFLIGYAGWFTSSLRQTRGSLLQARRDADATLRSIADAVITLDGETRVILSNPVAERLTGKSLAQALGKPVDGLLMEFTDQASDILGLLNSCLESRQTLRLPDPVVWHSPDARERALQVTVTPVGERSEGAVLAFNDVTDILAATAQLRYEATHDALTGLPNRTLLYDRLQLALLKSCRQDEMVALLFVDLDRFKRINDSLGHYVGDAVLKTAADRLLASVRDGDTVSRWGGDEFIILMESLKDRSAVVSVAHRVLELIDTEFEIEGESGLILSCSIGIALGPTDSMDAHTLLSMADKAMYRGKQSGGSRYNFYAPEMNNWSRDRLKLESSLRLALQNREFELFFQPQIDVAHRCIVGLESLIRWRQPGKGLVAPDQFIPVAEESGLICPIGDWVIQEAVEQAARWRADGLKSVPIAINVSARQCFDTAVVDTLRAALRDTGLETTLLKVELTESTAMKDPERALDLLRSIHALGVEVSVDDFGTGYSSLSLLRRFPISELKIDRSFVSDVRPDGGGDAAIVRSTIALAHGLGMSVVAEGVETEFQLEFLARHKCDVAQGYLFSRPVPANEIRAWLAADPPH